MNKKTFKRTKSPVQKDRAARKLKRTILFLIITYFLLDFVMFSEGKTLHTGIIVLFAALALAALYSFYAFDYHRNSNPIGCTDVPRFVKNKKRYVLIGWLAICIYGIIFLIAEPFLVSKFFPVLDHTYYRSQITLMLYIAPIIEELIFRYLLYDRWLKRKFGWFWGFVIASLVFVACHPVTNVHALVIYWVPTLLFFLIYQEFGLYGSIVMHMIYNTMAI